MQQKEEFERTILAHLNAAYNLARWLTRRDADAGDVVQEACVRAFRHFNSFRGVDSRAWLLAIVRNTCYTWLRRNRSVELSSDTDLDLLETRDPSAGPEEQLQQRANQEDLRKSMDEMPLEFREILVLRELEGLTYKEICAVTTLPMGTVMSRLSRARDRLQESLRRRLSGETRHGM